VSLQLVRIVDDLPEGFDTLRRRAEAEGFRHMTRLADDWGSGLQRFDREGEALFAAFAEGRLAGVGGLTHEPKPSDTTPALRMRRLYVDPDHRRMGVGRTLASALMQEGLGRARRLTAHAGGKDAALFWEAMGFTPVAGRPWSHVYEG